jgi:hypothetical protein
VGAEAFWQSCCQDCEKEGQRKTAFWQAIVID